MVSEWRAQMLPASVCGDPPMLILAHRITNGIWSDYATMAVRTGGPGPSGLSLVLVPLKGHPGVTMRRMQVQGSRAGGTTFIELDDVHVPIENLIGQEGQGMKYIMVRPLAFLYQRPKP